MQVVADNAFAFEEAAAREVSRIIMETDALVRRCEHCLLRASARAT